MTNSKIQATESNVFAGCILYADGILLLSSSYSGLQELVNICYDYGLCWDINFNSAKSQCISFGECYSPGFIVLLGDLTLNWVNKLKSLGCYFIQSCTVDFNIGPV